MKIALVSPYDYPYPGGVTEHIVHLAAEFRARGHEVHIIAPQSEPMRAQVGEIVHPVGSVVPVPANGSVARISLSLRLSRQVKEILEAEQFDVIHLHEPLLPALPITVLRHSHSVNVGTFHAFAQSNYAYFYGKPILRYFVRRLHGRIAVSPPARDFVADYFPGEYEIIPNGIDFDKFAVPAEPLPAFREGGPNILFVGRLEKRKGLKYLLRAMSGVWSHFPEARLIVVGSGPLLEDYKHLVESHRLQNVVFTGFVSSEDLPRYYRSCDVFCAPSTGQESFGIVLLEAMASGKPLVASDIPGYRFVVNHGVEGLLVPPKDEQALALSLVRLLSDGELRARMGQAGLKRAEEFSWDKVAGRVLAFYEKASLARSLAKAPQRSRWRRAASSLSQFLSR
ncbi:MAG: glycosyltransferase family 4 protein [Sphingomonadaceae bacterium]